MAGDFDESAPTRGELAWTPDQPLRAGASEQEFLDRAVMSSYARARELAAAEVAAYRGRVVRWYLLRHPRPCWRSGWNGNSKPTCYADDPCAHCIEDAFAAIARVPLTTPEAS